MHASKVLRAVCPFARGAVLGFFLAYEIYLINYEADDFVITLLTSVVVIISVLVAVAFAWASYTMRKLGQIYTTLRGHQQSGAGPSKVAVRISLLVRCALRIACAAVVGGLLGGGLVNFGRTFVLSWPMLFAGKILGFGSALAAHVAVYAYVAAWDAENRLRLLAAHEQERGNPALCAPTTSEKASDTVSERTGGSLASKSDRSWMSWRSWGREGSSRRVVAPRLTTPLPGKMPGGGECELQLAVSAPL